MESFDLSGRTAIVTGGTRGIGRAIAAGLVAVGANVVVASRDPEACAAAAQTLGDTAIGVATDVGDIEAIEALVETAVERFGGIDIVVNNAGTIAAQSFGEITAQEWERSFGVNLRGPVFLVQAALPYLRESRHAAVLNIVSAGAFTFSPALSMYGAAKAALVSFTRSMAAELAEAGIRVNALAPGPTNTDMTRANPSEVVELVAAMPLLKRIAEPEEMVAPALLLVSDAGSYITGQTLVADGGIVAH